MPAQRILTVCTANICRSPTAQRLFAARVDSQIEFFSRGVAAVQGAGMCGISGNWLATRNAFGVGSQSAVAHTAQQFRDSDCDGTNLILTATDAQRQYILSRRPEVQAFTYSLIEAARIVQWMTAQGIEAPHGTAADRLDWLVQALWKNRSSAVPRSQRGGSSLASKLVRRPQSPVSGEDLADPHAGGEHRPVLAALEQTVRVLASAIAPGRRG